MSSVLAAERRRTGLLAARPDRAELAELAAVAVLTLVALALRASQRHQSIVGDEVLAYSEIVGHSFGQMLHSVHTGLESSPPLFFILAWLSVKLGDPTVWIRLPSIVLGSATVPMVYALGRELAGRRTALVGAAVFAVAPFAVYYGIEARPYATMMFFVALSTLALVRALRTRSTRWLVVYVLAAAAAAYSHYTCVFVLAVQALWSLWVTRRHPRRLLIANGAIVVLYLPWVPELHGEYLSVYGSLYPLGAHRVLTDLLRPITGDPSAPLRAIPTIAGLVAVAVTVLAGATAAIASWRRCPERQPPLLDSPLTLLGLLVVATPLGVLLYSLLATDLWLPRNLSASLPAAAVALGALLAALPRPALPLACAAVFVTLVAGTLRSFGPAYNRGPYRTIAAYLDRVAGPGDPVTIFSIPGQPAVTAQLKRPHPLPRSLTTLWAATRPGHDAYLVLDETLARATGVSTPRPRGFALIGVRRYTSQFPTELLTYRRR